MTVTFKASTAIFTFILLSMNVMAQKVANYSTGKQGTATYEHLSFWTENGKRTEVTYSYGKDYTELKASYLGAATYQGKKGFKISLPGKQVLYVLPVGTTLKIVGQAKKYSKVFKWEYEGPVNGIGTFCSACAEDEKEAIKLVSTYFLK
jgi:hypothetical protein